MTQPIREVYEAQQSDALSGGCRRALVVGLLVAGTSWQSALPLPLLACPLLMVFMMRGMGGHGGHGGHGGESGQHHHDAGDRDGADTSRRL